MTEYLLKKANCHLSIEELHHELSCVKEVNITSGNVVSKAITDITQEVRDVFSALNITLPKKLAFDYLA